MTRPRIVIEAWDPEYGSPLPSAMEDTSARIDPNVELPASSWKPLSPSEGTLPAKRVAFVDGVRRIEAPVWIEKEDGTWKRGICASYAAGVVISDGRARIANAVVRRGLFTTGATDSLPTRAGVFEPRTTADDGMESLTLSLQLRLGELEIETAAGMSEEVDLVVVDGPLSGRQNVPGAVGYVKTHRVSYLPNGLNAVVGALAPAERTPLFVTETNWTRYSWYARLPGPAGHSWAGVVRMEASADHPLPRARQMADLATATLPAYASSPHKEPRAPQNLYPIGALERELRRRLGDAGFIQRSLRLAVND